MNESTELEALSQLDKAAFFAGFTWGCATNWKEIAEHPLASFCRGMLTSGFAIWCARFFEKKPGYQKTILCSFLYASAIFHVYKLVSVRKNKGNPSPA